MEHAKHDPDEAKIQNGDVSTNWKQTVGTGYDMIATKYFAFATQNPSRRLMWSKKMLERLPPSPALLEIGCGAGVPVTKYLLDNGCQVTANDLSVGMIELAKKEAPRATYIIEDMTKLSFTEAKFGGVVMFFSLFHIPLEEQRALLGRIHGWLKPSGHIVLSVGATSDPSHRNDFLGADMLWANAGSEGTIQMVKEAGFEVLESEVKEEGNSRDSDNPDQGKKFLWILAKKS